MVYHAVHVHTMEVFFHLCTAPYSCSLLLTLPHTFSQPPHPPTPTALFPPFPSPSNSLSSHLPSILPSFLPLLLSPSPSSPDSPLSPHQFPSPSFSSSLPPSLLSLPHIQLADYLIDPLCRGVFAGDAKTLSLRSCFPLLYNYEKEHGSLVKGALRAKKGLW